MSIEATAPGEPFRRTAADEETDHQLASANFSTARWKDWPNEAGVGVVGPIRVKRTNQR